jgi:hypothetical protein
MPKRKAPRAKKSKPAKKKKLAAPKKAARAKNRPRKKTARARTPPRRNPARVKAPAPRRKPARRRRAVRSGGSATSPGEITLPLRPGVGPTSGGQSGDISGLPDTPDADSESVEELAEEGQDFEAEIVDAVEGAPDPDEGEIKTREVPEDDVPEEYQDDRGNR